MTVTEPSAPEPRTRRALQVREERTQAMLGRVSAAADRLLKARTTITFAEVARDAQVSRTFLYEHPQARAAVEAADSDAQFAA
jgi:hypothetical protein